MTSEARYQACPGDRYISHALSVGMFDHCLACGFGLSEEGLVREGSPNKASVTPRTKDCLQTGDDRG